jgi:hypothetical protein
LPELNEQEEKGVDIFNLKIYALLICRGRLSEKTELLFDLIMQFNKESDPEKRILTWNHPRLKRAVKLIIFMSEILPKKFLLNQKI